MALTHNYRADLAPVLRAMERRMGGFTGKHGHPRAWQRRTAAYHLAKLRGHLDKYERGVMDDDEATLDDHLVAILCRASFVWLQRNPPKPDLYAIHSANALAAAKQVHAYLTGEPWPEHISVRAVRNLGKAAGTATVGAIHTGGEIRLDWPYLRRCENPLAVLVHEIAHCRGYRPAHGKEFQRTVKRWLRKLNLPPDLWDGE